MFLHKVPVFKSLKSKYYKYCYIVIRMGFYFILLILLHFIFWLLDKEWSYKNKFLTCLKQE